MINRNSVNLAQKQIQPYVSYTPLVPAYSLCTEKLEVRLKLETTQPIGAFKIRGAINALSQLTEKQKQRGVICASTGNHGRALAYAALKMESRATVCMSTLVPENKVKAIQALGADIHRSGKSQDEAQQVVDKLVFEQGMTEIPPFDHADVMAGQGTIGLEILEQWPLVDTLLIGLSGGGLLGGIALAAKSINPDVQIIGLSPERGAAMAASLAAGNPVEVEELSTLADSLGGGIGVNNQHTFKTVNDLVDDVVLLSELQIAEAMRHLFFHESLVAEGAGAVGVSLLIDKKLRKQLKKPLGERIAIVVSGRNVDMRQYLSVMNKTHSVYTD